MREKSLDNACQQFAGHRREDRDRDDFKDDHGDTPKVNLVFEP
jgi:hypothetical protein